MLKVTQGRAETLSNIRILAINHLVGRRIDAPFSTPQLVYTFRIYKNRNIMTSAANLRILKLAEINFMTSWDIVHIEETLRYEYSVS